MPKSKIYVGQLNGLKHWKLERLTILAIIGALITAGNSYSIIPDTVLAFMVPLHTFWYLKCIFYLLCYFRGVNSILLDYVPTRMIKTALNSWKVISVIHLLGLLWLNFRDIGISKLIMAFLYL